MRGDRCLGKQETASLQQSLLACVELFAEEAAVGHFRDAEEAVRLALNLRDGLCALAGVEDGPWGASDG